MVIIWFLLPTISLQLTPVAAARDPTRFVLDSIPDLSVDLLSTLSLDSSRPQFPQSTEAHLENVLDLPWKHLRLSAHGPVDPELRFVFTKRLLSVYPSSIIDCISSLLCSPNSTYNDLKLLATIPQQSIKLASPLATTAQMKLTNEEYGRELAVILDTIFNETFHLFLERNDYSQAYKIASAYGERNLLKSDEWTELLIPKVIFKVRSLGRKCRILRPYPDLFKLEIEEATLFVNSFGDTWDDDLTSIFNEELAKQESLFDSIRSASALKNVFVPALISLLLAVVGGWILIKLTSKAQAKHPLDQGNYICDGVSIESIEVIQPNRILKGNLKHDEVILKINQDSTSLNREVLTLKSLGTNPPYAILYLGHMLSPSPSIVTKYFSNSLSFYLVADSTDSLRLSQANQILKAVKWLHSKGIIHCDIKPENLLVLVDRGGRVEVKLCDFDSARHIGETICHSANDKITPLKFTPTWVCPEIFYYSKEIDMFQNPKHPLVATVEMDLFSLGLVVACTLSKGRTSEMTILPSSMDALRFAFDTRSYLKRIPGDLVSGCLHAVEKLWSFQPRNRGSIDEVINTMSAQGRTKLSNELQEESRRRELDASRLEKKISDLANVIQSLESQCLSSSPELTELLADVSMTMSQEMKMHFGNYLENIKDLRDDVIKGQRILEALQDQR